jgi:hypothetical protein
MGAAAEAASIFLREIFMNDPFVIAFDETISG